MTLKNLISLLLGAVCALSLSTAGSAEDSPELLFTKEGPLPLPTKPLDVHALTGLWWAQTIYDRVGEPIWEGGSTPQKVVLRVSLTGSIQTVTQCNLLNGQFGKAEGQSVSLLEPKVMTSTRMFCPGEYPPTVNFRTVASFKREGLILKLFDSKGLPVATYLDVYGLKSELETI